MIQDGFLLLAQWAGLWADATWRATWQGGLGLLGVGMAARIFPRLPAVIRCWLWRLAFLKLLAAFLWLAPISIPIPGAVPALRVIRSTSPLHSPGMQPPASHSGSGPSVRMRAQSDYGVPVTALFLFWLAGVAVKGLRVLRVYRAADRLRRAATPVTAKEPLRCCSELAHQFGLRTSPLLFAVDDGQGPLVLGLPRTSILVPAALLRDSNFDRLRMVLAHEMAHVARRDLLWNWLPALAEALFFFHPLVLLAGREWQFSQELACDERAMQATGASAADYGEALVRVVGLSRATPLPAAIGAASPQLLKRRLLAMGSIRFVNSKTVRAGALIAVLLGTLIIPTWRFVARAQAADATPLELLKRVRSHYQGLNTFTMNIRHQDSSGLFPGTFSQTLRWRKGDRFTLLVKSQGNTEVPDYYADGRQVHVVLPGGSRQSESIAPQPNRMPGWEVTGGTILGFLQNTDNSRLFFEPIKGMSLKWSYGPRTLWKGKKVREVAVHIARNGEARTASGSFFVDAATNTLVGFEWDQVTGKMGYALYEDQQADLQLPTTLGDAPRP